MYNVVKYYELIGDLYQTNELYTDANEIYYKILQLSESNDKLNEIKKRTCVRLCEFLINQDKLSDYLKASKLYFDIADDYIKTKILSYSVRVFILLGLYCLCVQEEI